MKRERWVIIDWAGKRCVSDKVFKSFEDAWACIYQKFDDLSDEEADEMFQEFEVITLQEFLK